MKRTKPLERGKAIARRTAMKKANAKRKAKEFARCYGSVLRVLFVQALPSIVDGAGLCENAHVSPDDGPVGMGRKGDYCWIVPLTRLQHREMHAIGEKAFASKYGLDLQAKARETEAKWQAHLHGDRDDQALP